MTPELRAWFYEHSGETVGPYTNEEIGRALAEGRLDPQVLLYKAGLDSWQPASALFAPFAPRSDMWLPLGTHQVSASPRDPDAPWAVASLGLGLGSLLLAVIPLIGVLFALVTSVAGLVAGIHGKRSPARKGVAIAGIVICSIELALIVAAGVILIVLVALYGMGVKP